MPTLAQLVQIRGAAKKLPLPSAEVLQQALAVITAGAGYTCQDGSAHCCGDPNEAGIQCLLYQVKKCRCLILGPDLDITPTMTCTHWVGVSTDNPLSETLKPVVSYTPSAVGLVETHKGANCSRCSRVDKDAGEELGCYWLTDLLQALLTKQGLNGSGCSYKVEPGGCCSFWDNPTQELIG